MPGNSANAATQLLLAVALAGEIALAGSISRGQLLLTGEPHICLCYKLNHAFDTCQGNFELFTAFNRGLLVTKSVKSLLFCIKKGYIVIFLIKK